MKKKILIISTRVETVKSFMLGHIKKLSNDYDVYIFCNKVFQIKKLIPKNVKIKNIKFERKLNLFSDIKCLFYLIKLFYNINFDITLSITPKAGFLTSISSFIMRVPYRFHWFTGQIWLNYTGFRFFFYRFLDILIFKFSTHVLIDSKSQRKFLVKNKIISNIKSTVLHKGSVGGVDIKKFYKKKTVKYLLKKKFKISKNDFVFLFLGRINCDKGINELIKAFDRVSANNSNLFLILVGPIESQKIKKKISKFKRNIIFKKSVKNPQDWYNIADILCLPSHREGFGSVIIEAAACGVPALASNIYGIQDAIISNHTGFFHKVNNENDIEKKMVYLLKNKKLIKKFGINAKKRVKLDFNSNLISKKLIEFIEKKIK